MTLPFGIDISKWNGVMDIEKLAYGVDISSYQYSQDGATKIKFDVLNPLITFAGLRAGISWGYTDRWYAYSKANLTVPRLDYHVVYPGESAERQMSHFLQITRPTETDRLVLDLELDHGYSVGVITQTVNACLEILRRATGRYPILYSRASWVNQYLRIADMPEVDWWLAHYRARIDSPYYTPELNPPPSLPRGVKTWLIHQTGERGNGGAHGVASYYIDQNRWNGTEQDVREYFGLEKENSHEVYLPIITKPEPEKEEPMFRIKITTSPPNRYVTYDSPFGKQLIPAYWVASQSVHEVYEAVAGWYRIGDKVWLNGNNVQWVKKLASDEITWVYYGAIYGQQDERWGDDVLGTKNRIKYQGCLLTANAMVCNHFEHFETPQTLNKWLTANRGYLDGNLFIWERLTEKYPDMISRTHIQKPTFLEMKKVLKSGDLPVIYVDMDDSTPQPEMHWLLGVGYTDTDIAAADPWTGTIVMLSEAYPTPPIRMGGYTKRK